MKELLDQLLGQSVRIMWRADLPIPPYLGQLENGRLEGWYALRVHLREVVDQQRGVERDLGVHLLHFTPDMACAVLEMSAITQPVLVAPGR